MHIWRVSVRQSASVVQGLLETLSCDEAARAARFHFPKDRDAFIVARGILRCLLARYIGAEPREFTFEYQPAGKPYLSGEFAGQIFFNVSHSHDTALYAISHQPNIGIDIEYIRPITAMEQVAASNFSSHENAQLRSLPHHMALEGFFNCWTRKEAFVKAIGTGISYPLQDFDVSLKPGEPARLLKLRNSRSEAAFWSMYALQPSPGYAAAVVVEGSNYSISHYEWTSSMSTSTL